MRTGRFGRMIYRSTFTAASFLKDSNAQLGKICITFDYLLQSPTKNQSDYSKQPKVANLSKSSSDIIRSLPIDTTDVYYFLFDVLFRIKQSSFVQLVMRGERVRHDDDQNTLQFSSTLHSIIFTEKTLGGGSSGGAGSNAMSDVAKGHQAKSPKSKIPTNLGRDGVNVEASPNGSVDDATKKGSLRVNSGSRRTVPKSPIPSARRASSAMSQQRKVLETQLSAKKKRYQMMKNELINNQKKTQVIYDEMMQLREKVLSCGGNDSGPIEEIKFMDTRGPRHSENRSGAMSPSRDNFNKVQEKEAKIDASEIERNEQELENSLITKNFLDRLEMIVREIPTKYQEFCQFALEKYFNIATFLTALAESNKTDDGSASVHSQRIEEYRKDTDVLKKRFEEINEDQTKLTDDLLASFYNLYEEYSGYRTKLKELNTIVKAQKEICDRYENSQMDLQAEQERKDQKTQLENQMAVARAKIRELESQLSKSEYKFQQMQANFKKSEEQHRCKEQTMDKRLKDMQKTLKNNETLVSTVETQRDTYEKRLLDLREKMSVSEAETANKMSQMNDRLNSIMDELENEKEKRREAEAKALSAEERNKKMEEKCQELCDMAQKKDYSISENKYSQKEIFLYNDLKNTRKELEEYKEKLKQVQNEKEEILSMMHQAAVEDDDDETKSKLAAELAVKSESLRKLATQCMKLEHELSIAKQRNDNLERQVTDIQKRLHAQMSDNGKNASIAHTIELQQQISELREALIEEQNHNKDIEKELLQKQLEVEERDRALREGSKILELREELLSIMNAQDQSGLETPEISESYSDMEEIDKQAWSKTKIIQDLHSRLENKQLQVMQLEKMVKQMEDQQDRAQAQRTRLESRIADLELSLQEKTRESRNKGFGIL
ncbi:putative leucine-rich repeat-containing protein DDB_G0290503 [Prorops nasuta]|uniref:putative leucine-rich repeat-containing protein DDB_G0290503 n=1 Tax=Prorops nasuta TaxID=863751 RepID=UPI0034CE2CD1